MSRSLTYCIFVLFILCITSNSVIAQQNNTLYYMNRIPQSNQLNPATQPQCGFYLGLPGLSSLEVNAGSTIASFNDIFLYDKSQDSLFLRPLQSNKDRDDFLGKLKKNNYAFSDLRLDWLSFGFRINGTYLSFSAAERLEVRGNVPYDMFDLALKLNMNNMKDTVGRSFNFDGLGVNATWFREYSIGVSQEINERLTFGIRGKLLFGKANVSTKSSNFGFPQTGTNLWKTNASMDLNSSIPTLLLNEDAKGQVDFDNIDTDSVDVDNWDDARKYVMNNKNVGFAVDLGIVVKPIEKLTISASLVDIGFIQWKSNLNNLSTSGSYDFKGLPLNTDESEDMGEALLDTLDKVYTYKANHDPYMTSLSGKLYAGAHLQVTKGLGLGFLSRFQMLDRTIRPQYTFSVNLTPGKYSSTSISYTLVDGIRDNLGFATTFRVGPFHWYIMSDRIPLFYKKDVSGIPFPAYAKNFNFRTGFNLVFGKVRHRKIYKDKPLVEMED